MAGTAVSARMISSREVKSLLVPALVSCRRGISLSRAQHIKSLESVTAKVAHSGVAGGGLVLTVARGPSWLAQPCRFCSGSTTSAAGAAGLAARTRGREAVERSTGAEPLRVGMQRIVATRGVNEGRAGEEAATANKEEEGAGSEAVGASPVATAATAATANVSATDATTASAQAAASGPPPVRKVVRRRVAAPVQDAQMRAVEEKGVTVEGVAKIDRGDGEEGAWQRTALLCAGDVTTLLLFAYIGRVSHGSAVSNIEFVQVATPFIAGWLLCAPLLGGYGADARGANGFFPAAGTAAKCWAVGMPLGLVIRGLSKGHIPPKPFVLITLGATFVLMVGWRTIFAVVLGKGGKKPSGNRRGNPLELLELLASLVRRW